MVDPLPTNPAGASRALPNQRVTLGGWPLETTGVSWALVPGVEPHTTQVVVDKRRLDKFWPVANDIGHILEFDIASIVRGNTKVFKKQFKKLSIIQRDFLNQYDVAITIADLRWKWRGSVSGLFNHYKLVNDFDIKQAGEKINVPGQSAGTLRIGIADVNGDAQARDVIAERLTQPATRYRNWSMQTGGSLAQLGFAARPWTALEIAVAILVGREVTYQQLGATFLRPGLIPREDLIVDSDAKFFSDYAPDRVEWRAKPAREALAEMLRLARANIYIDAEGKVRLYAIDDDTLSDNGADAGGRLPLGSSVLDRTTLLVEGSQFLYRTDYRVQRPASVRVFFDPEREIDLVSVAANETLPDSRSPKSEAGYRMMNVMRLPVGGVYEALGEYDAGGKQVSKFFPAGSIVPMQAVLRRWKCDDAYVCKRWFLQGLLAQDLKTLNGMKSGTPEPELDAIVQQLYIDFRQTFQADPKLVDLLLSIEPTQASVLDFTGRRMPSPIWTRYFVIPGYKFMPRNGDGKDPRKQAGHNVPSESHDPNTDEQAAPFLLEVLNPTLAVLRIVPVVAQQNAAVAATLPSALKESTIPQVGLDITGVNWGAAELTTTFRIICRPTIRVADPNNEDRLYQVVVKPDEAGEGGDVKSYGPQIDVFCDRDTARFNAVGQMVNAEMIRSLALAEARLIFESWRDRWTGRLQFGGGVDIRPWGPVASVSWEWSPSGEFTTVVDCTEPRPARRSSTELLNKAMQFQLERRPPVQ